MSVTVKVLTLLLHVNALFHSIIESLSKAIRPILNFIVGTNNFIKYIQRYQILIFIFLLEILYVEKFNIETVYG